MPSDGHSLELPKRGSCMQELHPGGWRSFLSFLVPCRAGSFVHAESILLVGFVVSMEHDQGLDIKDALDGGEDELKCTTVRRQYSDPLYAEQSDIVFDGMHAVARLVFVEKYNLKNKGINPKQIRVGTHIHKEEVAELFGSILNKNGYRYGWSEDEEVIKEVERLYMSTTNAEASGFAYERKKKKDLNWAAFAE